MRGAPAPKARDGDGIERGEGDDMSVDTGVAALTVKGVLRCEGAREKVREREREKERKKKRK